MKGLIIDLFAGGGGASVGIEMALGRPVDIAINHDPAAILMHKTNHPRTKHITEDIFTVDLQKYVGGRKVDLMWASPDCTQFSKAKGGKPREHGIRVLPWAVYEHTKAVKPSVVIMENVEEIQQWGALDENGYPIEEDKGKEYERFIQAMKDLGYAFDCRELVAADYGAPTTRKRWYAIFRNDGRPIRWPAVTHFKDREPKWKACGDYVDWSDLGTSIFDRKKPLAEATQRRIANGIRKYIIENEHPYIVKDKKAMAFIIQYHAEQKKGDSRGQLLSEPIKTIDTSNRYGLVTAFLTKFYKTGIGQGCDEPVHTITTSPGRFGLVSVYAERIDDDRSNFSNQETNRDGRTSAYAGRHVLENSQVDEYTKDHPHRGTESGSEFEKWVSGSVRMGKRETVSCDSAQGGMDNSRWGNPDSDGLKSQGREQAQQQPVEFGSGDQKREPLPRIQNRAKDQGKCGKGSVGICEAASEQGAVVFRDSGKAWGVTDNGLPSRASLVSSLLIKYYGTGKNGESLAEPLATVTTKDRFGLVNVLIDIEGQKYIIADIFLRMLNPEELKQMQGFPKDYIIDRDYLWRPYPKSEQVARIGNSVVPVMAEAIVKANCPYLKVGERAPSPRIYFQDYGQMAFA